MMANCVEIQIYIYSLMQPIEYSKRNCEFEKRRRREKQKKERENANHHQKQPWWWWRENASNFFFHLKVVACISLAWSFILVGWYCFLVCLFVFFLYFCCIVFFLLHWFVVTEAAFAWWWCYFACCIYLYVLYSLITNLKRKYWANTCLSSFEMLHQLLRARIQRSLINLSIMKMKMVNSYPIQQATYYF